MSDPHESAQQRLDALLKEGKITAEEYHGLWQALHDTPRAEGQPAQPPFPPNLLARVAASAGVTPRDLIVLLICYVFQIIGFAAVILRIPVLPAIAGFASIIAYLLRPNKQHVFVNRLGLIAAICGGIMIIYSILTTA